MALTAAAKSATTSPGAAVVHRTPDAGCGEECDLEVYFDDLTDDILGIVFEHVDAATLVCSSRSNARIAC
jgi:hypothetical protein